MENPKLELVQSPFVKGSIKRIRLENFLTYDSVEFRPGPSLNVIIGPNGTGKSTIVCGICMGLAGKTSLLGRALSPMEYIKHGQHKALIEIELFNPAGENYIFRREIQKDNSSKWSINGRNATLRTVEVTVQSLNIQVGNLCQFLPQDKVADFAKMTQQELLENTEKAVGTPQMYEQHHQLKTARESERTLEVSHERANQQLEHERTLNARMEQDVKNYQEREKHMDRINQLKAKRPWLEYEDKRREAEAARILQEGMKEQVRAARKKNTPFQKKIDSHKSRIHDVDGKMKKLGEAVKEQAKLATDCHKRVETQTDQMQELHDELTAKQQEENTRKRRLRDISGQIKALEDDLNNLQDQDVQPRIDQVQQEMSQANHSLMIAKQHLDSKRMEYNHIKQEVTGIQAELRSVQNIANRRLEELRKFNKDAYDAVMWLRANKHRFKGEIYEPLMLTMNVKDPNKAKYLENHISSNDMRAFMCERNDDMTLFMDTLRTEQKLRINVIVAPSEPASSFKPNQPIASLARYGFRCYLQDLFECPELVMRYLCRNYRVHKIPVGDSNTKTNVETVINRNPQLTTFYTENHRYDIKKSLYSDNTSSSSSELRRPHVLAMSFDSSREQELKREIESRQADMKRYDTECRDMEKNNREMEKQVEHHRNEKKELMGKKNARRQLLQNINMKKDKLARVETDAIDLVEEENAKKKKVPTAALR